MELTSDRVWSARRIASRRRGATALVLCSALFAVPMALAQKEQREGVLLLDVTANGPAAQVGLSRGTILLEVAGVGVNNTAKLVEVLQQNADEAVCVRYRFWSQERRVRVRLGNGEPVGVSCRAHGAELNSPLADLIEAQDPGSGVEPEVSRTLETLIFLVTLAARPKGSTGACLGVQCRPANITILRFQGSDGERDDDGLRGRIEERWREWLRGVPVIGRFMERQLSPI